MTLDEYINERLIQLYGKDKDINLPKYRIVWGPFQTEKRYGKYDLLYKETKIWMGKKEGLVEIKKYWYLNDCWILERIEPNYNKDVFYDKYTYEPLLTFLDKDNKPLPLAWKPIEFIVSRVENAARKLVTEKEHQALEDKKDQEEYEKVYGILDKPDPIKPLPTFQKSTLLR